MGLVVNILYSADLPLDDRFWLGVDHVLEKQGFALEFSQDAPPRSFARVVEGNTPDIEEPVLTVRCDEEGQALVTVRTGQHPEQEEEVYTLAWDAAMQARLKRRSAYLSLQPSYGPDDSLEFFNALVQAAAEMLDGLIDDAQAGTVTTREGEEYDYPPDL